MKWIASILVGAVLPACLPDALDVAGKRCSADRPCGSGFVCADGKCVDSDAGNDHGPNLLVNGGFESSDLPEGWASFGVAAFETETWNVHEGKRAASINSIGAGGLIPSIPPVSSSQAGTLYCARAYVWGTGALVLLSIVDGDIAGPDATKFRSPLLTTSGKWTEIDVSGRALGGKPLTVVLWTTDGGTFCVDDLELWSSARSTCE